MSPAWMRWLPSWPVRTAQRPVKPATGGSSQRTSDIACPTLRRPPASGVANRASASSSRRVFPIQYATGCCAEAMTAKRSWSASSSR